MKLKTLTISAGLLALAACGSGDSTGSNGVTADNADLPTADTLDSGNAADSNAAAPAALTGQQYADEAAASDMFEIESAKLARDKAKSADVKALAAMLVTDHQKSTADLKAAGKKASPAITPAAAMNAEQNSNVEALRSAAAADFDRLFLTQQVAAHEKALAMVRSYGAGGDVDSLKQHATTVSGPIQRHLDRARELSQKAGQ